MKFKRVLTTRSSVKKKEEYEFEDIPKEVMDKGKKRDMNNPLLFKGKFNFYLLYSNEGKLRIDLLHSYDVFEEVKIYKMKEQLPKVTKVTEGEGNK